MATAAPPRPAALAPPPDRLRVRRILRAHADELRRMGVARLRLFGSLARGEAQGTSDVDVLIDVASDRPFSLFALGEVRARLRELLGREVDVAIAQDLGPKLRRRIEADLVPVF